MSTPIMSDEVAGRAGRNTPSCKRSNLVSKAVMHMSDRAWTEIVLRHIYLICIRVKLLIHEQSGFRESQSRETVLLKLTD